MTHSWATPFVPPGPLIAKIFIDSDPLSGFQNVLDQSKLAKYVGLVLKSFLRKNLGNSRAFVASTWSKFKRDSQYQLEEVQDWASHLEHLQSVLIEFDADGAPEESDVIRYFQEALRPSIKAEMENQVREYEN